MVAPTEIVRLPSPWWKVFVALFMLVWLAPVTAKAEERQWVQASWLDVHEAPDPASRVIAHWVTNTPVLVEQPQDTWCLARAEDGDAGTGPNTKPVSGYVLCYFLGKQALALKDARGNFWIAPSVQRFIGAGSSLNSSALSAEQEEREKRTQTPVRFPIPEFEAMKARLSRGVVPVAEQELARVSLATFNPFEGIPEWRASTAQIESLQTFDPHRHLPTVKPSLFKRQGDALIWPDASVDAIAAMLQEPNAITYAGQPQWVNGHHDEGVTSIWDIGWVEVQYAKPVSLHSVSHTGLVGARILRSTDVRPFSPDDGCNEGYPALPEGELVPDYPQLKDQPLISFVLPKTLPLKKIDVLTRKAHVVAHASPSTYSGSETTQSLTILVHTLDLDRDGIPDFAIFEWNTPGYDSGYMSSQRYQFINVAGEWWYAGHESYGECS